MAGSRVQQATAVTSGFATSIVATFGSTPTNNNLLVAKHFTRGGDSTEPGTWTTAVDVIDATQDDNGQIAYRVASSDGTTVTFTTASSDTHALHIEEWTGMATSTPLDVTATAGPTANQGSHSTGTTATTAQADAVAFAMVQIRETAATTANAWTNSFTHDQCLNGGQTNEFGTLVTAHKILSATGTQESTLSGIDTAANNRVMGGIAVFKASTGGGATTRRYSLTTLGVG